MVSCPRLVLACALSLVCVSAELDDSSDDVADHSSSGGRFLEEVEAAGFEIWGRRRADPRRRRTAVGFSIVDWDKDGDLDIVAGRLRDDQLSSTIRYLQHESNGQDCEPAGQVLLAEGVNQTVGSTGAEPAACGLKEQGGASNGFVGLDVYFDGPVFPAVADWDGDGDNDLLIGGTLGRLHYFEQIGTGAAPLGSCFRHGRHRPYDMGAGATQEPHADACQARCNNTVGCAHFSFWRSSILAEANCRLQAEGTTFVSEDNVVTGPPSCSDGHLVKRETESPFDQFGYYLGNRHEPPLVPKMVDWDGDSDNDLIVGTPDGKVHYFERVGTAAASAGELCFGVRQYYQPQACGETEAMQANGTDYRGCRSTTRSGYTCQKWSSQSPHTHTYTPDSYLSRGVGDHNYCRNPSDSEAIWCYTTTERWEYCDPLPQAHAAAVATSAVGCQTLCASTTDCAHFSFWGAHRTNNCLLHHDTATLVSDVRPVSGPPTCAAGTLVAREGDDSPFAGIISVGPVVPEAADWDGDADLDLILGRDDGNASYYERTSSSTVELRAGAEPFASIGIKSRPLPIQAVDWNSDGTLELVVLNTATGAFHLFANDYTGGADSGDGTPLFIAAAVGCAKVSVSKFLAALAIIALAA